VWESVVERGTEWFSTRLATLLDAFHTSCFATVAVGQRLRSGDSHSDLPKCGFHVIPSSRFLSSETTLLGGFDQPGKYSGSLDTWKKSFGNPGFFGNDAHVISHQSPNQPNRCQGRPLGVSQRQHLRSADPAVKLAWWFPTISEGSKANKLGLTKNGGVNCNGQK
jgi:hypothetical protein